MDIRAAVEIISPAFLSTLLYTLGNILCLVRIKKSKPNIEYWIVTVAFSAAFAAFQLFQSGFVANLPYIINIVFGTTIAILGFKLRKQPLHFNRSNKVLLLLCGISVILGILNSPLYSIPFTLYVLLGFRQVIIGQLLGTSAESGLGWAAFFGGALFNMIDKTILLNEGVLSIADTGPLYVVVAGYVVTLCVMRYSHHRNKSGLAL